MKRRSHRVWFLLRSHAGTDDRCRAVGTMSLVKNGTIARIDYEFSFPLINFYKVGQGCVPEVDALETALHSNGWDTCIICDKPNAKGIRICNQLICDTCQKEMIDTGVDEERYKFFIKKLGKISVRLIEENERQATKGK